MNKINTKKIVLNLGILAIMAFGLMSIPAKANADLSGYFTPYGSTSFNNTSNNDAQNYNNQNYNQAPTYYYPPAPTYVNPAPAPTYVNPAPAPTTTIYSNSTNPNPVAVVTIPNTIAKAKTTTSTKNTSVAKKTTPINTDSSLAANAIFGSNSFLPSGLIQWILFAILVLLIVILVRKIYGGGEAYHAAPMKHD